MRRPGGAVRPAMKDTTGLRLGPWCQTRCDAMQYRIVLLQKLGSILLGGASNLTDHDDAWGQRCCDAHPWSRGH